MPTRPHKVDLESVAAILAEARQQESEVLSTEVPSAAVMARLGAVELEDSDGSRVTMGSLWDTRPAAVVFLRHYG
ncbi:MAG: hypothetical protein NVS3B24_23710 [Candidatus Dormibacteria bacterium]